MEFFVLAALMLGFAYVAAAPHNKVLRASRGTIGALSSANKYRKKGTQPKNGQPKSYFKALRKGYNSRADAATQRRDAGKDFWGRVLRAAGWGREGYETAKDLSIYHNYVKPVVDGASRANYLEEEQEADEEVFWDDDGEKVEEVSEPETTTDNTTEGKKKMVNITDLEGINAYIGELTEMGKAIEELLDPISEAIEWGDNLPDRFNGTKWHTDAVADANTSIAEATSGDSLNPEAMLAAIKDGISAAEDARKLGELADELGADGDLSAYRAA